MIAMVDEHGDRGNHDEGAGTGVLHSYRSSARFAGWGSAWAIGDPAADAAGYRLPPAPRAGCARRPTGTGG